MTAKVVRHFLQSQQFAEQAAQHDGERGDEKPLEARQKSSVHAQPDKAQREKNGGRAEGIPERYLRAGGKRFAPREAEQRAEQNADGIEKGADGDHHAQTQPLSGPRAKPEIFCARPQSLLLKGG